MFLDAQGIDIGTVAPHRLSAGEGSQTTSGPGILPRRIRGRDWSLRPKKEKNHRVDMVIGGCLSHIHYALLFLCNTSSGGRERGFGRLTHSLDRLWLIYTSANHRSPIPLASVIVLEMADLRHCRPMKCKEGFGRGF